MSKSNEIPHGDSSVEYKSDVQNIIRRAPGSQHKKFLEAAREHETDDSEERFDKIVKRIAKAPPPKDGKGK